MRRAFVALGLVACGGSRAPAPTAHTSSTGDDGGSAARVAGGRFARADVEHAIERERKALELLDARIADADAKDDGHDADAPVRRAALHADRVAGAAFVAQLDACLREPADCPPSFDEPAIPADFDPATRELTGTFAATADRWPAAAAAIEQAACGCRTGACIDWVLADLDRWENNLPAAAQADESAATHVVGARACIWARLGRKPLASTPAAE